MPMFLPNRRTIVVDDYEVEIVNDFRAYLSAQKVLADNMILDEDKPEIVCGLLFAEQIPPQMQVHAIEAFFKTFSEGKGSGQKVFDMEQDKELIYAGFVQSYGIDLDTCHLSIEQFLALLKGLPENTRFSETIKIRTMPLPAPTKYNAEQRSAIMRAKQSVALKANDENLAKGWKGFASMIRGMAKNGRRSGQT